MVHYVNNERMRMYCVSLMLVEREIFSYIMCKFLTLCVCERVSTYVRRRSQMVYVRINEFVRIFYECIHATARIPCSSMHICSFLSILFCYLFNFALGFSGKKCYLDVVQNKLITINCKITVLHTFLLPLLPTE